VPGGFKRAQLILDNNRQKITEKYSFSNRKLGEGSYGFVSKATHKSTQVVRAVKTMPKDAMKNQDRFRTEIDILKELDHPNIIKLFETFEDRRNFYLVMELCLGGELFDRILEAGHFSEDEAAAAMQHILRAVLYMHENGVTHRDLKPENFLFQTKEPIRENTLKVIDFGLSSHFESGTALRTRAGTAYYVAPQVLAGRYDRMCDLWSAGVIMYTILCGYPPFYGDSDEQVLACVRQGNYAFEPEDWRTISRDAKDLVRNLIKMNPAERFDAAQAAAAGRSGLRWRGRPRRPPAAKALGHLWLKNRAPGAVHQPLGHRFLEKLRRFRSKNNFKKAALQIIAGQLSEGQIRALRDTFTAMDENNDGLLSVGELKEGLRRAGLGDVQDMPQIMEAIDADADGQIAYTEFLAATLQRKMYLQEDVCWTAFGVFDIDGDGRISPEELRQVLRSGSVEEIVSAQDGDAILEAVDKNGDGLIDFEEFMEMMRGSSRSTRSIFVPAAALQEEEE
jgi:calcium-dependent protein kinase